MYYDTELGARISESQFAKVVGEAGIETALFHDFLHAFASLENTPKIVLARKAIKLLSKQSYPARQEELFEIIRLSLLKFSGTDGMRGVVDSTTAYTPEKSIQAFVQKKIISPHLCTVLASGFASMLRACKSSLGRCVAIAEDGRDQSEETSLVAAIASGLQSQGFEVEFLGVVPTPSLAAWSLANRCGAIMVTASHNPHQYNGMKFFIEGKKLFPQGPCGEFALASYAIQALDVVDTYPISHPKISDRYEEASSLFASLFAKSLTSRDREMLANCHFVIDCANGALSYVLPPLMESLGFSYQLVAAKPGKKAINKDCGAAQFEGLYSVGAKQKSVSPLVEHIVGLGPIYQNKRVFGIVVDGDGDRGLVLVPHADGSAMFVLHGDDLLLLLARRNQGSKGLIRVTLESDNAIVGILKALSPDFSLEVTAVGDRHLSVPSDSDMQVLAGGEDSGHLVFPIQVDHGMLYSGNGMLSALIAISVLVTDDLTLPLFVRKGVDKRSVMLRDTGLWFSQSALWNQVEGEIAKHFPRDIKSVRFAYEPDMVSYRTEGGDLLYVRASGTEPKLSVSFSRIGDTGFNKLVQSLTGLCARM